MNVIFIAISAALVLLAAFQIWRKRKSFWWPPFVVFLLALALFIVYLTSDSAIYYFFEIFVGKIWGFFLISFLNWVFVRAILPRCTAKYATKGVLIGSIAFPFGILVAGFSWWFAAAEVNVYPENVVVRTDSEFQKDNDAHRSLLDYRGMFLEGRVGDLSLAGEKVESRSDLIAYFQVKLATSRVSTETDFPLLPLEYNVTLSDGTKVTARGVNSLKNTFGWPEIEVPGYFRYHGLKHGDPVVIWADPNGSTTLANGEKSWTLINTRIVAYGTAESFREDFILPGVRTARLFGWVGFGSMFLAFIPFGIGLRKYFWLKKHGSDEPPPVNQPQSSSAKEQELARAKKRAEEKKKSKRNEPPPTSGR
ncbi:MAG: hypothetical protein KDN20_22070 [Verrucomicrobiae bacterium]|nr:hypothetical protein [Verrucomicrobiae bacterium]